MNMTEIEHTTTFDNSTFELFDLIWWITYIRISICVTQLHYRCPAQATYSQQLYIFNLKISTSQEYLRIIPFNPESPRQIQMSTWPNSRRSPDYSLCVDTSFSLKCIFEQEPQVLWLMKFQWITDLKWLSKSRMLKCFLF